MVLGLPRAGSFSKASVVSCETAAGRQMSPEGAQVSSRTFLFSSFRSARSPSLDRLIWACPHEFTAKLKTFIHPEVRVR